eukprot:m.46541 g.46541  ORF g.46541 m.46541 type:complete len:74 (-) comp20274_c0_seq1:381-602(-)
MVVWWMSLVLVVELAVLCLVVFVCAGVGAGGVFAVLVSMCDGLCCDGLCCVVMVCVSIYVNNVRVYIHLELSH